MKNLLLPILLCLSAWIPAVYGQSERGTPNLIIIFTDDQGYGDLGCYGAQGFETPHIDQMAEEGIRFTDFYVAAGVCTPSRAALMTGCYPKRLGLAYRVLFPYSTTGLNPEEITLAELLKSRGYATGAIGKWHLGHRTPFLPTRQGFDTYFGIPYSNDMGSHPYGKNLAWLDSNYVSPPTPILENETLVESQPDQHWLTQRYTQKALEFIETHQDRPFFLYLAHAMPHVPIAASPDFAGQSDHGLYGDVIEEIDHSVGQILAQLKSLGIDENTWVIFTSDNGPQTWEDSSWGWTWTPENEGRNTRAQPGYRYRSGSPGPLRGRKNTTWEGGQRVPCVMRWPARIPGGQVSSQVVTSMDIFPTMAALVGIPLPEARRIDGKDIGPILHGQVGAVSPHVAFYYYRDDRLQAVRSGPWKLHVYRPEWGEANFMGQGPPLLFNLEQDPGESRDLAARYPGVVSQLQALADAARQDLGDAVLGMPGAYTRPVGQWVED